MQALMSKVGTPDGQFHDGNPATGAVGTILSAHWLNQLQAAVRTTQQELISVLDANSIPTIPDQTSQLLRAMRLIAWGSPDERPDTLDAYGIKDAAPSHSPVFTGRPAVPSGSVAAPGLTFSDDPDTGLYSPGLNQIGLAVGGVAAFWLDAARNAYHAGVQLNAAPGAGTDYEFVNRNGAGFSFYTNAASRLAAYLDAGGRLIMGGQAPAPGYTGSGDVTLPPGAAVRSLNTCKAWAAISGYGALLDGFNISTVTRVYSGLYTITLGQSMGNANYAVVGFCASSSSGETSFGITEESSFGKTVASFQVQTGNTESNGRVDPDRFYIFIFGRDA